MRPTETVIGVPIPVLLKITYDSLKEAAGSLRSAIDTALEPFSGSSAKKWRLGYCRLAVHDGRLAWRGPAPHTDEEDNEFVEIEMSDDSIYASAAYFEDIEDLTDLTDAVVDESGRWHEPVTTEDRAEFRRNFHAKFVKHTAPDTVLAIVYCWSQSQ